MAANGWLVVPTKKQVLVSETSFVNRKRSLSFEISRYLFAGHDVELINMFYLP